MLWGLVIHRFRQFDELGFDEFVHSVSCYSKSSSILLANYVYVLLKCLTNLLQFYKVMMKPDFLAIYMILNKNLNWEILDGRMNPSKN